MVFCGTISPSLAGPPGRTYCRFGKKPERAFAAWATPTLDKAMARSVVRGAIHAGRAVGGGLVSWREAPGSAGAAEFPGVPSVGCGAVVSGPEDSWVFVLELSSSVDSLSACVTGRGAGGASGGAVPTVGQATPRNMRRSA